MFCVTYSEIAYMIVIKLLLFEFWVKANSAWDSFGCFLKDQLWRPWKTI